MRDILFTVVFVLIAVAACSIQQKGEVYFPKASQGTQWEYLYRQVSAAGMQIGRMIVRIEGSDTLKGNTYEKETTAISIASRTESSTSYFRRTLEGIYRRDRDMNWPEYLETPFPVREGNTWITQTSEGQIQYQAEKLEPVDINNIQYGKCLKISFKGRKGASHFAGFFYLAPGVGEVYRITDYGNYKTDYALISHKLK